MASASPAVTDVDGKVIDETIAELQNVETVEEFETKFEKSNKFGFSIANWMKILFNRAAEEEFIAEWLSIDEYKRLAEESMQQAFKVITLPNWKFEKRGATKGDIVETKQTEAFGKVYRFTGLVDCPAEFLYNEFKNNVAKLPEWNPTILRSELIKEIGPGVDLSYQVTAGGGKGIIAPRDFVNLRRCASLDRQGMVVESDPYAYISSGVSVNVPGYPPNKEFVRGNNKVGCWFLKPVTARRPDGSDTTHTQFQWLMCCDLKGKIPQFVLDAAFATVMLDYIVHVRKFTAEAKARGLF